jgi:hypothetical protein
MTARTGHEAEVLTPGSFVIERYVYSRLDGKTGVQWIVHRVSKHGGLEQLIACKTRREAAHYIEVGEAALNV